MERSTAVLAAGLAGCADRTCDCVTDVRRLQVFAEPANRAQTATASSPAKGTTNDAPTATWKPATGGTWQLRTTLKCQLLATDRPPFRDVALALYTPGGAHIRTVPVGDVTTDNGFTRDRDDGGCCPGPVVRFTDRVETLTVERFPHHVVATATVETCAAGDELGYAEFVDGEYDRRTRGCDETLPFRDGEANQSFVGE